VGPFAPRLRAAFASSSRLDVRDPEILDPAEASPKPVRPRFPSGTAQADLVFSGPGAPPPKGTAPGDILVVPTDQTTGFHNLEWGSYTVYQDCTGTFTINNPPIFDKTSGATISGAVIVVHFALSDHGRSIHTVVTKFTPPGVVDVTAPALIRSDGHKLGRVREDWD
jgi:hypothetical protein